LDKFYGEVEFIDGTQRSCLRGTKQSLQKTVNETQNTGAQNVADR